MKDIYLLGIFIILYILKKFGKRNNGKHISNELDERLERMGRDLVSSFAVELKSQFSNKVARDVHAMDDEKLDSGNGGVLQEKQILPNSGAKEIEVRRKERVPNHV
jgi:hypothetical protein